MSNLQLSAVLELIDKVSPTLAKIALPLAKTQKAFDDAKKSLKEFETQSKMLETFKSRTESLATTSQKLATAQDKLKELGKAMAATENPSRRMTQQFAAAQKNVAQLQDKLADQTHDLDKLSDELRQAGINTDNFADEQARLANEIKKATTHVDKQAAALEKQQKIQADLQRSTELWEKTRNVSAAVGAGSSLALGAMVKEYAAAEDAATRLQVSMMDSTGKVAPEFEKINKLASRLGNQLPGSVAEFNTMMATLVQQGIKAEDILGGVGEASANLAVVMKMPFNEAAEFAAKMQDATKTTAGDMLKLMDVIQKSYYLGVDSTNMLSGFSKIADGMKTIKMEGLAGAEAVAPLLVMADQAAMSGESAGNAYSKIFKAMMDTKKISKALQGTGIEMNFTDGMGEFAGFDKMFSELEKLKGLSTEARLPILADMFGNDSETIQALNLLIDKGQQGYNDTLAKMKAQADLQQRVNAQLGTLTNLWDAAKGSFTGILVSFGEALAPDIKNLIGFINDITTRIGAWAEANPALAQTLMRIFALIAACAVALSGLASVMLMVVGPLSLLRASLGLLGGGGMITAVVGVLTRFGGLLMSLATSSIPIILGVLSKLGGAFMFLLNVVRTVGLAMMANPILAVIGLIAMGAVYIWQNWGTLGPKFAALWATISAGASALWARLVAIWNNIKAGVIAAANQLWSALGIRFSSGIAALIAIIAAFSPVGLFMRAFAAVFSFFAGLGAKFRSYGANMIEGLKQGIMGKLNSVLASIRNVASQIKSAFTSAKAMDIHSPSRVFMGYGDNIMQGLNNGLLANTAPIGAMLATSQLLKNALDTSQIAFDGSRATTLKTTPNTAQGGNPSPIVINIYAQKGQSEEDIARLVADKLGQTQAQSTGLYDYASEWG